MKITGFAFLCMVLACPLSAESVGSYVQVTSQKPLIVLDHAKVIATNGQSITVTAKAGRYTFDSSQVEIKPSTAPRPYSEFIASPAQPVTEVAGHSNEITAPSTARKPFNPFHPLTPEEKNH